MAIAAATTMSNDPNINDNTKNLDDDNNINRNNKDKDEDNHEHDMVMPGFRFHPTEEELVEFYLRRKVEGKRFNVELITFLDLYRYDPWDLPALAAIGEKEWFFYVPRDRKYRNGDRPNRVTTSGYWKATGADRMIRAENLRSIGLKKTLVFYSGKAPKGIRTSWIMNEYRLPHHETERYQKGEISLCRVYKRAGVEDHPSLPRCLPTRPSAAASSRGGHHHQTTSSSSNKKLYPLQVDAAAQQAMERFQAFGHLQQQSSQQVQMEIEKISETTDGSSSTSTSDHVTTALGLSKQTTNVYRSIPPPIISTTPGIEDNAAEGILFLNHQSKAASTSLVLPNCTTFFPAMGSTVSSNVVDDLHRLVSYQQAQHQYYITDHHHHQHHHHQHQQQQQQSELISALPPQSQSQAAHAQQLSLGVLPGTLPTAFSDRLWEWNPIPEANREYNNINPFK